MPRWEEAPLSLTVSKPWTRVAESMDWPGAIQQWTGAQPLEPVPPQQQQPQQPGGRQGWLDAARGSPSGALSLAAQWRAALRPPDLDDGEPAAAYEQHPKQQLPRGHREGPPAPHHHAGTGPGQRLVPALQQAPGHPAQTVPGGAALEATGVSSHQLQYSRPRAAAEGQQQWQQGQWRQPPPPPQQHVQWQPQGQWQQQQQQQGPPAHPPQGQHPGRQPLRLRLADWGLPPRVVEVSGGPPAPFSPQPPLDPLTLTLRRRPCLAPCRRLRPRGCDKSTPGRRRPSSAARTAATSCTARPPAAARVSWPTC